MSSQGDTFNVVQHRSQLPLDSRPSGLYHHKDKFALTFIRWADLNFMQSG